MTTTDLTTTANKALATTDVDPFQAYADAAAPQHILGRLLKHAKGEYLSGEHSEVIPLGTKMIAAMDVLSVGWVRWSGGKPVEHIMALVADGVSPPRRGELGDTDPADWEEKDPTGAPRDPYQLTNYVPCCDESGEVFTFSSSSRGGVSAIAALARIYAKGRKSNPDKFPVIELQVDAYTHSNPTYGRIRVPKLVFVGWESKSTFFKAAGLEMTEADEGDTLGVEPAAEMSDAIPF